VVLRHRDLHRPKPLISKNPEYASVRHYRKYNRKLPVPRQMICTDIRIPAEQADKAFVRAWNLLVGHWMRYVASFRELARDGENELIRYRASEMIRLLNRGRIRVFDYGLCNQVLDHIEITADSKLAVIFLTGTRVTV